MTKKDFPVIPGYIIKEKLGEGGMANVYLAMQEKLEREVAIKVLDPLLLKDEQILKRFKKEAQTAAKLVNPNIVTVYDVGQSEPNHYIVMEYLKESLRERIKTKGKIPPPEALGIIHKIAAALSHAHHKGIIHRDIKPDNIMFRPDGNPVLVDFGIARALDFNTRLTMTGMRIGTPHYMSPEQCKGEDLDGRSDIYSLGVVFYELLTGNVPYKSETPTGLIYLHTQAPIPILPAELNKYQPLIDTVLAKRKEERVKGADELRKHIERLTTGQTFQPPAKRKKRLAWFPAILAAVFLALLAYYFIVLDGKDKTVNPPPVGKNITDTREKEKVPKEPADTPPDRQGPDHPVKVENKNSGKADKPKKKTAIEKNDKKKRKTTGKPKQTDTPEDPVKKVKIVPREIEKEEKKVKTVNFANLSREVIAEMNQNIERLEILNLEKGVTVGGEIGVNLTIAENGQIQVKQLYDTGIIVNPADKKEMVKQMIITKIAGVSFAPSIDETGEPQKIENWRITYKLGTFKGTIILY